MKIVKAALPVATVLAIVIVATAILMLLKTVAIAPQHVVFFYLLPTVMVAVLFGSMPAMLCAVVGTVSAAFFLYDPVYSFYVSSRVDVGELVCFAGLALIGAKCTADLLRPHVKLGQENSFGVDRDIGL
jgi:K+-sensing histidine kinase KdpD